MHVAPGVKRDFPIFQRRPNGKPIIYLDSTATALKPASVIRAVNEYYTRYTANVFRGIYKISEEATLAYEDARKKIAAFINASPEEIVFTRNTDESINLIVYSLLPHHVLPGDMLVTTIIEHHANFVPWQQYAMSHGCTLKTWKIDSSGQLDIKDLDKLVTRKTKVLAFTAASNVLGTLPPVTKIVAKVKSLNPRCLVLVDAAQAVPHMPVDVQAWGADVVAFSGHKMLGPSGIGVLWAKKEILESMPPFLFGGDMIREVHERETIFNDAPHKFEAGTPYIEGAIGLGAAVDYLSNIGMDKVREHEKDLVTYALSRLSKVPDIKLFGPRDPLVRGGVVAFQLPGIHPHDIAQVLDNDNIYIRVGFHCAQPLHEFLGIGPTARASFYIYTTKDDIDALVEGLKRVRKLFT